MRDIHTRPMLFSLSLFFFVMWGCVDIVVHGSSGWGAQLAACFFLCFECRLIGGGSSCRTVEVCCTRDYVNRGCALLAWH
jgi:hypothetical protein